VIGEGVLGGVAGLHGGDDTELGEARHLVMMSPQARIRSVMMRLSPQWPRSRK